MMRSWATVSLQLFNASITAAVQSIDSHWKAFSHPSPEVLGCFHILMLNDGQSNLVTFLGVNFSDAGARKILGMKYGKFRAISYTFIRLQLASYHAVLNMQNFALFNSGSAMPVDKIFGSFLKNFSKNAERPSIAQCRNGRSSSWIMSNLCLGYQITNEREMLFRKHDIH